MGVCGIKRVNDVVLASYGEADVGTYCPGLPHRTPERWMDGQRTDGGREGRERGKKSRGQMTEGK